MVYQLKKNAKINYIDLSMAVQIRLNLSRHFEKTLTLNEIVLKYHI